MLGIFFICYFVLWVSVEESLPNCTGTFTLDDYSTGAGDGKLFTSTVGGFRIIGRGQSGAHQRTFTFNMSKVIDVYKTNGAVRPRSLSLIFLIKY